MCLRLVSSVVTMIQSILGGLSRNISGKVLKNTKPFPENVVSSVFTQS